jgi:hypothetical protein
MSFSKAIYARNLDGSWYNTLHGAPRPEPKPRLEIALERLSEQPLFTNTEMASLQLGDDCWKVRTSTKRAGTKHCIITFHNTEPFQTATKIDKSMQPDLQIETVVSQGHWITTATHLRAGTVKFDTTSNRDRTNSITAILLSEAQYLDNEATLDILGSPLYNVILAKTVREESGVNLIERVGFGRIYKYT